MSRTQAPQVLTLESIKARSTICGECWEYQTNAKTEHFRRYVAAKHEGKMVLVRRLAYELAHGFVRDDLSIVAACGNPYCINPEHQKALTESQKSKRAAQRGAFSGPVRAAKIAESRRRSAAKLTAEQAAEIRGSSESGPVLSERYGVDKSYVNRIKRGDAWKEYGANPFQGIGAR